LNVPAVGVLVAAGWHVAKRRGNRSSVDCYRVRSFLLVALCFLYVVLSVKYANPYLVNRWQSTSAAGGDVGTHRRNQRRFEHGAAVLILFSLIDVRLSFFFFFFFFVCLFVFVFCCPMFVADVHRVATHYCTDTDVAVAGTTNLFGTISSVYSSKTNLVAIGRIANLPDYSFIRNWTYQNRF
jgi:hypothetical protein